MKQSFYKLRVPNDVARLIRNMHPELKKRIKSSLQMILTEPDSGKALKDELAGLRSLRVGRFRIIYKSFPERHIEIVAIGPRNKIYEETYRLLKKNRTCQK